MISENNFFSSLVIFISILLLILLTYSVFYIPNLTWVMPWLSTIGVFFWVVFAKKEFGFGHAFLLGLIEDIVVGTFLGFHGLALIIMYRLALQQSKYLAGKPFKVIWFAYTISLTLVFASSFLLNYILGHGISTISPLNWVVTVLIFPIIFIFLLQLNSWIKK